MIEYTVRVHSDATKYWHLNDKRHREDGPAIERADGTKWWWLDGKLHREDGPAIEYESGYKEWWLDGKQVNEEDHKASMNPTEEMTMEQICEALGKQVKVIK